MIGEGGRKRSRGEGEREGAGGVPVGERGFTTKGLVWEGRIGEKRRDLEGRDS